MSITISNTFVPSTPILSAEVNENFQDIANQALSKAGDTMTGTLIVPIVQGVSMTLSATTATALDVAGGITAGTGNVGIVDTTGKIPALTSTYFASLDGSALTGTGGEAENNVIAVQVFS